MFVVFVVVYEHEWSVVSGQWFSANNKNDTIVIVSGNVGKVGKD